MSKCIDRNLCFLNTVIKKRGKNRANLVSKASKDNIDAISEIALNTLKGNVKNAKRNKLKKYRDHIVLLSKKSVPIKKKKAVLVQKGGFLPLLIAPLLTALGTLAARAISKKLNI